jgi:hypothetical protein
MYTGNLADYDDDTLSATCTFKLTRRELEISKVIAELLASQGVLQSPTVSHFWRYLLEEYLIKKMGYTSQRYLKKPKDLKLCRTNLSVNDRL